MFLYSINDAKFDLCHSFVGESMHDDGMMVFAYYKEGATDPTFLYLALGLKEVKCWEQLWKLKFSFYSFAWFSFELFIY